MQFYKINIRQVIIFRLHTVYNKHEMIKIIIQTREKSQVLEKFCCRLYRIYRYRALFRRGNA